MTALDSIELNADDPPTLAEARQRLAAGFRNVMAAMAADRGVTDLATLDAEAIQVLEVHADVDIELWDEDEAQGKGVMTVSPAEREALIAFHQVELQFFAAVDAARAANIPDATE